MLSPVLASVRSWLPFPFPSPLILPDRTSPSRVRFAAFRALLTRGKGESQALGVPRKGLRPLPCLRRMGESQN